MTEPPGFPRPEPSDRSEQVLALYRAYRGPMRAKAARIVGWEGSESIVHDVVVKLLTMESLPDFQDGGAYSYLMQAVRREAGRQKTREIQGGELERKAAERDREDGFDNPEEYLDAAEGHRELIEALEQLEPRELEAVVRRDLHGETAKEVGERLGVTGQRAGQLHQRALRNLADIIRKRRGEQR